MNKRFLIAFLVIACSLAVLIYSGVSTTAKQVVTVSQLLEQNKNNYNIRLGAKVADKDITYQVEPMRMVSFFVHDIQGDVSKNIEVEFYQAMPDTLKRGRDVILEGDYKEGKFVAKNLVTQCPSKYVPPAPNSTQSSVSSS